MLNATAYSYIYNKKKRRRARSVVDDCESGAA